LDSPNGRWLFTIPVQRFSSKALIHEIKIAQDFSQLKLYNRIRHSYIQNINREGLEVIDTIINNPNQNLFTYVFNSVLSISEYLGINKSKVIISSQIGDFTTLRGQDRVIEICRSLGATTYLNPIGGISLYDQTSFMQNDLVLEFLKPKSKDISSGIQDTAQYSVIHNILTESIESLHIGIKH
jgi:hypothetical protein